MKKSTKIESASAARDRWFKIGERWSRRAKLWKWLYTHGIMGVKALTMEEQCLEEAILFYEEAKKQDLYILALMFEDAIKSEKVA